MQKTNLLALQSTFIAENPYEFELTGIKVYTLEEAIYHSYLYPKESIKDLSSPVFIDFIKVELQLPKQAGQVKAFFSDRSLADGMKDFLSMTDQIEIVEIEETISIIKRWENRQEWEKLLELANMNMSKENYYKAEHLYKKAAGLVDLPEVYYNTAIAQMQVDKYEEAVIYLEDARKLALQHKESASLLFTIETALVEAYIYNGDREKATDLLAILDKIENKADKENILSYVHAQLLQSENKVLDAIGTIKPIFHRNAPFYIKESYIQLLSKARRYDDALDALDLLEKNVDYYVLESEVYSSMSHFPAAIVSLKNALDIEPTNSYLWSLLASYSRLEYKLEDAHQAISKALSLNPQDKLIRLEDAKIKKAAGDIKEYQQILSNILGELVSQYKEIESI